MKSFESLLFALPFVQSVHVVLPGVEFRPEPHAEHSIEPVLSAIVLGSQFTQAELLVEPLFSFFFPAAQSLQSVMFVTPIADEYLPCGHFSQNESLVAPRSSL